MLRCVVRRVSCYKLNVTFRLAQEQHVESSMKWVSYHDINDINQYSNSKQDKPRHIWQQEPCVSFSWWGFSTKCVSPLEAKTHHQNPHDVEILATGRVQPIVNKWLPQAWLGVTGRANSGMKLLIWFAVSPLLRCKAASAGTLWQQIYTFNYVVCHHWQ